jgi:hypothetical protein
MSKRAVCEDLECAKCGDVIARTYRELRKKGCSDREAFLSSVNVLELRHPGHERYYYFRCTARLLGDRSEPTERQ